MDIASIVRDIEADVENASNRSAPVLRRIRRKYSASLKQASAADVLAVAETLQKRRRIHRFVGDELIANHPHALSVLDSSELQRLGSGISSWDEVDCFACYLSGPAWREGQIKDATILAWARSADRWWRRAALVSTVPLNVKARGGVGDPSRTLRICRILIHDRDPMVVKALSWALRALAVRDPNAVETFLATHDQRLHPLVLREVRRKLDTGRKL
jgi:3-methyladenine DNA glycosylase AlkD